MVTFETLKTQIAYRESLQLCLCDTIVSYGYSEEIYRSSSKISYCTLYIDSLQAQDNTPYL